MRRLTTGSFLIVLVASTVWAQQTFSYEQLTVSSSATTLTVTTWDPPGGNLVQYCEVKVESASVRYRVDGPAATATAGSPIRPDDPPLRISPAEASRLSLHGYVSATSSLVNVRCGR